jgi:hypothetical protein
MRALAPLLLLPLALLATAGAAQAACYADYRASRRDPFELHYGVAEIFEECARPAAEAELRPRLEQGGWQLLEVASTFDESGLEERRESAGDYFLRY